MSKKKRTSCIGAYASYNKSIFNAAQHRAVLRALAWSVKGRGPLVGFNAHGPAPAPPGESS